VKESVATRKRKSAENRRRWADPAYRAKVSAALTGKKPSAATCAKLSAAKRGRKLSPEHRSKIAAAQTGRKLSAEHRANVSAALAGRTFSADHRAKLSAVQRELLRSGPQDPRHCEICNGRNYRGFSLNRDHDHVLGHFRGLLCRSCNQLLGHVEAWLGGQNETLSGVPRDEALLRRMFEYLRRTASHSFQKKEA